MDKFVTDKAPLTSLVYSVDETAVLLGISRSHAYDLVNSGQIQGVKLGRSWRIPRIAVDRILAGEIQIPA